MIDRFWGRYRFLSNFYPAPVSAFGIAFPTVEHAYQASKTENREQQLAILACSTPGKAKRAGRYVDRVPDFEARKPDVMLGLLRQKFDNHPDLREKLLATGDEELIEGNDWDDTYWGVCDGEGENHLGRLLMQVRTEIRRDGVMPQYRERLERWLS